MAREKCGHLAFPRTVRLQLCRTLTLTVQQSSHLCDYTRSAQRDKTVLHYYQIFMTCKVPGNPRDNYDMSASVFVVQFNGFM